MSELSINLIKEAKERKSTYLDLGNCGLTELPDELFELTWLTTLLLCSTIDDAWFEDADGEEYYSPSHSRNNGPKNNIKKLSPGIKNLINLKTLYLNGDYDNEFEISDISPLGSLENIEKLYIYHTNIIDFKPLKKIIEKGIIIKRSTYPGYDGTGKRQNENGIYIGSMWEKRNKINPPIYIIDQGNNAILRYWQEFENKETIINNQIKLILVGNSQAGKTSLYKFLKDNIFDEQVDSTHGIKIEIWDSETLGTIDNQNLAAHIWDFGGQEYYHATHRLFLSENAVYVLVWEKDSNSQGIRLEKFKFDYVSDTEIVEVEHFPASYWIDSIRYYGGNSPVLIVQNKVDAEELKGNYAEGVQNINDCFHLSIKNAFAYKNGNLIYKRYDLKFQDFKERLLEILRANATQFKLLKYYTQVREVLEKLSKTKDFIPFSQLKDIALRFDKTPDLENLLAYFKNFTNTLLHFSQNAVLKDRLYLNPIHISHNIYKILNNSVRKKNGRFDIIHIQTCITCDEEEANRYVALMTEFDLIFEKSKTTKGPMQRQFVAPQYLPKKEDISDDISFFISELKFETGFYMKFKFFVPRSLMLRFIANNGALSNQETYWHNGIIYKSHLTQNMIKVEYDHENYTFNVYVQDRKKQIEDMQKIVTKIIKLNDSDKYIHISNDGRKYVSLRTIQKLQHENIKGDIYDKSTLISLSEFSWLNSQLDTQRFKESVSELIGEAKTKEAIKKFLILARNLNNEDLYTNMLLLLSQLEDVERNRVIGLISYEESSRHIININNSILYFLNSENFTP